MIKYKFNINFIYFLLFLLITFFSFNSQNASEILIYADEIFYDKNENLIGKGKAKILYEGPEKGTAIQHFKDHATAFNNLKRSKVMLLKSVSSSSEVETAVLTPSPKS